MSESPIQVRVKTPNGSTVVDSLTKSATIGQLLLHCGMDHLPIGSLKILRGFPPAALAVSDSDQTLEALGICDGDAVTVEPMTGSGSSSSAVAAQTVTTAAKDNAIVRQEVPADNSCLFTSINFCMSGKVNPELASFMREIIAAAVTADPERYNAAILGKPNDEYSAWIKKTESWGGAIEAQILSEYLGVVISVVDTQSGCMTHFGEGLDSGQRLFLIYDGIHYDPLHRKDSTLFPVSDEAAVDEVKAFCAKEKAERKFTDVNAFSLRCITCSTLLTGQADARKHAADTGHTNFGEV